MKLDHETSLAWDLADALSPVMTRSDRATLCVHLGAGDQSKVIFELLRKCVGNGWQVPVDILVRTRSWALGFKNTQHHTAIDVLIDVLAMRHAAATADRPRRSV